jgi:hypothetical protein
MERSISFEAMYSQNKNQEKKLVQNKDNSWAYEVYAQVKSIKPFMIDCGDFDLEIFSHSSDERLIGEYIYYPILRLDIYAE